MLSLSPLYGKVRIFREPHGSIVIKEKILNKKGGGSRGKMTPEANNWSLWEVPTLHTPKTVLDPWLACFCITSLHIKGKKK